MASYSWLISLTKISIKLIEEIKSRKWKRFVIPLMQSFISNLITVTSLGPEPSSFSDREVLYYTRQDLPLSKEEVSVVFRVLISVK